MVTVPRGYLGIVPQDPMSKNYFVYGKWEKVTNKMIFVSKKKYCLFKADTMPRPKNALVL